MSTIVYDDSQLVCGDRVKVLAPIPLRSSRQIQPHQTELRCDSNVGGFRDSIPLRSSRIQPSHHQSKGVPFHQQFPLYNELPQNHDPLPPKIHLLKDLEISRVNDGHDAPMPEASHYSRNDWPINNDSNDDFVNELERQHQQQKTANTANINPEALRILDDIGMSEEDLVTMGTVPLNKKLKITSLSKEDVKTLKTHRRVLKNRGYAANCRRKRDDHKEDVAEEILHMETRIENLRETNSFLKYDYNKRVKETIRRLKTEILNLDTELIKHNISDTGTQELLDKLENKIHLTTL